MKLIAPALALLFVLAAPRSASATSILVNGDMQFTVNWLNTATTPDLMGSARFTITGFSSTGFDLMIDLITNSTDVFPNINARLVSFGFGLTPSQTTYSSAVNGSIFDWGFSNFPAYGQVDVCAYAGQNCAGGGRGGLAPGQTMPGYMSIHFSGNFGRGVTFSPIPVKFQTNGESYQFDGCIVGDPTCDPNQYLVPEPASLTLFGAGLAVLVYRVRRGRRSAA